MAAASNHNQCTLFQFPPLANSAAICTQFGLALRRGGDLFERRALFSPASAHLNGARGSQIARRLLWPARRRPVYATRFNGRIDWSAGRRRPLGRREVCELCARRPEVTLSPISGVRSLRATYRRAELVISAMAAKIAPVASRGHTSGRAAASVATLALARPTAQSRRQINLSRS